ncbi:MAG: efflux RND transporter periplasmic adaptor subunit [Alphaproteobacteria bacterium]|nr:efflux RND transporter periplasmic adaptor subunit [Alphaproteobacteria bacterium]
MAAALRSKPRTARQNGPSAHANRQRSSPANPPRPTDTGTTTGLEMILALEARFRAAESPEEIGYLAANDMRKLTGSRQTFVLQANRAGSFKIKTVSSLATLERDAPLIRWIEKLVATMHKEHAPAQAVDFTLPAYCDNDCQDARAYPFRHLRWQPLKLSDGTAFAGILEARERPFTSADQQLCSRLADALGHSWRALTTDRSLRPSQHRLAIWAALTCAVILAGAIPVPLTTIAPMQITASDPYVITAPMDGVIKTVSQAPNTHILKGQTLFNFDDTSFRNRALLAERELAIAKATHHKTRQQAFSSEDARYQLAITRSEHALKAAELAYANELLSQSHVTAPVSGIVIYPDKNELEGRPVVTGEAVMEIADPQKVEIQIDLPVADAIVLKKGADVRVFLDAAPLEAREARIITASYHAQPQASGQLAYKLTARFKQHRGELPRIGAHGSAQVFGQTTSLAFFLLRRPIAAIRQTFGF